MNDMLWHKKCSWLLLCIILTIFLQGALFNNLHNRTSALLPEIYVLFREVEYDYEIYLAPSGDMKTQLWFVQERLPVTIFDFESTESNRFITYSSGSFAMEMPSTLYSTLKKDRMVDICKAISRLCNPQRTYTSDEAMKCGVFISINGAL